MQDQFKDKSKVKVGMMVVGADVNRNFERPNEVGRVREVGDDGFCVDARLGHDIFVPFSEIRDVDGEKVALKIPADQVGNMGWESGHTHDQTETTPSQF